jgi:hypothetical protein
VQVAPALADDLVRGGERDQVREAFERERLLVAHELGNDVVQVGETRAHSTRVCDCSRRYCAR